MPLVTIETIAGSLSEVQKNRLILNVTEAVVEVEGENMRGLTWVRIHEFQERNWAVGGRLVKSADLRGLSTGSV